MRKFLSTIIALLLVLPVMGSAAPGTQSLPLDDVSLLSILDLPGTECRVADAALLEDGTVILTGSLMRSGEENTPAGWVACVDPQNGETLWQEIRTADGGTPFRNTAIAAIEGGYILCGTNDRASFAELHLIGDAEKETFIFDGAIMDICAAPEDTYIVAGQKDAKPWIARIGQTGEILWEQLRDTPARDARYIRLTALGDGVFAGGTEAGYLDLLDHYSWRGTWDISAKEKNAGSNESIHGIAMQGSGTVIVCGTNQSAEGTPYATSSSLDTSLGILAGPQKIKDESGLNDVVPFYSLQKTSNNTIACGFSAWGGRDVMFTWVTTLSNDGYPYDGWYIPFGSWSEAVTAVQLDPGTLLVIGHGNGTGLDAQAQDGIRPYILRIILPVLDDTAANG